MSFGKILDYISWRGDLSFSASDFNDVDALILCQLSYLNLNSLVPETFEKTVTLRELAVLFATSPDFEKRKHIGMMINPLTVDLLFACGSSRRFGNMMACGFADSYNREKEEQFSAVTFLITESDRKNKKNLAFVAFRGTDDTLIGWKEDFNLAFMESVPSQEDALSYLGNFSKSQIFKKCDFMVGGHSKGGNLAVFACAKLDRGIKSRLLKAYNFDGPGFLKENLESPDFLSIKERIVSVYPQFSIVGMLFYHYENYNVVASDQKFIMQHDPFSWFVCARSFYEKENLEESSEIFFKSFNTWFEKLSSSQRKAFVESVFEVLLSSGAKTSSELAQNALKSARKIIKAFASLDSEIRDSSIKIVLDFLKVTGHEIKALIFDADE